MSARHHTSHGQERCSQRNCSTFDLDVIDRIGTPVEGGLLVLQRDARAHAAKIEREAQRVLHLANTRIVFSHDGAPVVYATRSSKRPCPARTPSAAELEIAKRIGTPVEGGLLVLSRDAIADAADLRRQADRIRQLANTRSVFAGDAVVTVYRARRGKQQRLLRTAEESDLRR